MRKFILFLFLCLGIASAKAIEAKQLVIQAKDGTKVSYLLRSQPKISFSENEINVSSNDVLVTYSVPQTAKFYYETIEIELEEGLMDLQTEQLSYRFEGNAIIFSSIKEGSRISMYAVNGSLIYSKDNIPSGEYMFSLDNLSTGAYLINVNETTCKIIKQ